MGRGQAGTPAEQYQALLKEYQDATKAFQDALRSAKTAEERQKVIQDKNPSQTLAPTLALKFVELAEKIPKDPASVDGRLIWGPTNNAGPQGKDLKAKAMDLVLRDHVESDKLGPLFGSSLGASHDRRNISFQKTILAKHPIRSVQRKPSWHWLRA